MSKSPRPYLQHILDEITFLQEKSHGLSRDEFLGDSLLKRAFVRSIEIIGEATKHLPPDTIKANSDIDWRAVAGTRDKLIHAYFGIDYEIVWDIITSEIPKLKIAVNRMLDS